MSVYINACLTCLSATLLLTASGCSSNAKMVVVEINDHANGKPLSGVRVQFNRLYQLPFTSSSGTTDGLGRVEVLVDLEVAGFMDITHKDCVYGVRWYPEKASHEDQQPEVLESETSGCAPIDVKVYFRQLAPQPRSMTRSPNPFVP